MSKLHIKKDDTVIVIAGADKGKTGKVLKVLVDENRAIVEGVHMVSKSTKPSAQNPQGGIVKQEAPIHISNLSLIDPKSGKATRVAIKHEGKNVVRIAKKSGEEITSTTRRAPCACAIAPILAISSRFPVRLDACVQTTALVSGRKSVSISS